MPFCNPDLIKIPEGRFREVTLDDPAVVDRANSIKEIGQLQPILVVMDGEVMQVVDGATRLLACRKLKRDVWWVDEKEGRLLFADPRMRRVAEFQANFSRKDFTPTELARAIAEVDTIMRGIYGSRTASPGSVLGSGWTQEDTAKKLGYKSKGSVSTALLVAAALDEIPSLAGAKTMADAVKIVKDTAKLEAMKELANRQTFTTDVEVQNPVQFFGSKVILGDCVEKMKGLGNSICNLFITDPPFAEDLDIVIQRKGEARASTASTYRDDPTEVLATLRAVIHEMARVGKPMCQVVMFCSESNWHILRDWFVEEKFSVYERTLLWVKAQTDPFKLYGGRTMNPVITPASSYEMALYAWRGGATLAQPGSTNVFVYPPLASGKKFHIAQKPIALLRDIISRFYHPGTNPLLIDPFCGSGSTLIAARRLGITQYFGYERDPEFRERAVAHLVNTWMEEQKQAADFDLELEPDEGLDENQMELQ
jgi:DNA modification methylase